MTRVVAMLGGLGLSLLCSTAVNAEEASSNAMTVTTLQEESLMQSLKYSYKYSGIRPLRAPGQDPSTGKPGWFERYTVDAEEEETIRSALEGGSANFTKEQPLFYFQFYERSEASRTEVPIAVGYELSSADGTAKRYKWMTVKEKNTEEILFESEGVVEKT